MPDFITLPLDREAAETVGAALDILSPDNDEDDERRLAIMAILDDKIRSQFGG